MESISYERIKLALKVLSAGFDRRVKVSRSEIEMLKSYLQGDVTGLSTDDLASAVIQQELNRQKMAREKAQGESA